MPRLVAFLQGINLGNRRVKGDRLREVFEGLGLEGVDTYLASGNVIFDDPGEGTFDEQGGGTPAISRREELERRIEAALDEELGFQVATFVRSIDDLERLLDHDVVAGAEAEGFTPYVSFLREALDPGVTAALDALATEDDRFHLVGRHVFWLRRGGISDTTITRSQRDAAFGGAERTRRKLTTVRRLVEKFGR